MAVSPHAPLHTVALRQSRFNGAEEVIRTGIVVRRIIRNQSSDHVFDLPIFHDPPKGVCDVLTSMRPRLASKRQQPLLLTPFLVEKVS